MTKTEYAEYLRSKHWLQRRKESIADAYHACQRCDLPRWTARLIYDQDLHVHHVNYQHLGNEKSGDLEVLCRRCHEIETFGRSDFKEIKKAECVTCHMEHWNIYFDQCDECRTLFSALDNVWLQDEDGSILWVKLVGGGVREGSIPTADILTVIAEAARTREAGLLARIPSEEDVPF